jgi:hypothetical protein
MTTLSLYRTYDPSVAAQAAPEEEFPDAREHDGVFGGGVWEIVITGEVGR